MILTNSALSTFRTCQRRYELKYVHLLVPKSKGGSLRFGSLVHDGLDAVRKASDIESWRDAALGGADESTIVDVFKASAMVACYSAYWGNTIIPDWVRVVSTAASEQVFAFRPKGARYKMSGKVDGVVLCADGVKCLLETKTTTDDISPGSDYWQRLNVDQQIDLYCYATGVNDILYDVVRTPQIRPKKIEKKEAGDTYFGQPIVAVAGEVESPTHYAARLMATVNEEPFNYFKRMRIRRSDEQIALTIAENKATAKAIRSAKLFTRNSSACTQFMRTCEYIDICPTWKRGDPVPLTMSVLEEPNPELKETA